MDKQALEKLINSQKYSFYPDQILEEAQYYGLINNYEQVSQEGMGERRWGFDQETVYKIDSGDYLSFDIYVMTGDGGDDELLGFNWVKPVEKTVIVYAPIDS
jgi:hypothetical protein